MRAGLSDAWRTVEWPLGFALAGAREFCSSPVTALRRAFDEKKRELRASEQRLQALLDNSAAYIFVKDRSFCYMEVNGRFRDGEAMLGRHDFDLFDLESARVLRENDEEVVRTRAPLHVRETIICDGRTRHFLSVKFPLFDAAGDVEAVSGISTEITEMVAAEQEQQRMQAKMLEAQKLESLGVLAGGIAHDFNNHLTGILGNVTLALFELGQDHAVAPLIEQIETAALTASHLTGQLLAYAGKGKFFVAALDLSRVVSEMSSLLHTSLPKKVRLDLDLSGQLPAIECDRSQLHQVIMNLVLNAAESIDGKEGVVTLRTSLVLEPPNEPPTSGSTQPLPLGRYVKLEVSDTGSGMDSETIGKIFDPFFTTRFAGRGLGLPATLGIVGGHGGAIYVRSVPGQGSVFEVYLPAADALPVDRRNDAPRVGARLDACFEGTILLADDEHLSRTATGNMLRKVGFRVIEAADGLSAVEAFRDHADEVSLVLLDLTMPRLGGEEVLAAIRLLRLDVPVVVMSGFARDEVSRRFASMPPAGVLEKPFGVDDLMLEVLQHLEVPALAMTP